MVAQYLNIVAAFLLMNGLIVLGAWVFKSRKAGGHTS